MAYAGLCRVAEQRPLMPDTYVIPAAEPVDRYTFVFDTLHGVDARRFYRTDTAERRKIEADLDQLQKRGKAYCGAL